VQLQLLEPIVSPRVAFCGSKSCWIFWRGFHPLRALRRGRHGPVFLIKLFPDRRQLAAFEIADFDRAPSFGSAHQRTEHHFRDRAFTEGIGNVLEAPPLHRSSKLVVRIARRCVTGKRRWAMQASKSSMKQATPRSCSRLTAHRSLL
jgi:hypothetical protein